MSGQILESPFRPPWWLRGAHAQTILPAITRRPLDIPSRWERFLLPDGDRVDLCWSGPEEAPLILLLHGLGGAGDEGPVPGMAQALLTRGWAVCRFHFRGCGPQPNLLPKVYHCAMTEDPSAVLLGLRKRWPQRRIFAVGFSLGGNVLLRLMGELGEDCPVEGGVAVSVPFQMHPCVERMEQGFSRIYMRYLLGRIREQVASRRAILEPHVDVEAVLQARTFRELDGRLIAPLHGFSSADDYYDRAGCASLLPFIRRPALIIQSRDDPFMRSEVLPAADELAEGTTLEVSDRGGHVGFVSGGSPWQPQRWLQQRIPDWIGEQLTAGV